MRLPCLRSGAKQRAAATFYVVSLGNDEDSHDVKVGITYDIKSVASSWQAL